jgi:hypothetical protein
MMQIYRKGGTMGGSVTGQDEWLLFQVLTPAQAQELASVLEVLLPHEGGAFEAARLATALSLDSTMVGNLGLRALVLGGITVIRQACLDGSPFVERTLEQRTEIVAGCEDASWFQTVLHLAKADFYNRHIVWKEIGYPDLGNDSGYLDKGFDRLRV